LFAEKDGTAAASQFKAFEDTWEWNQDSAATHEQLIESGGSVSDVMQAFGVPGNERHAGLSDDDGSRLSNSGVHSNLQVASTYIVIPQRAII